MEDVLRRNILLVVFLTLSPQVSIPGVNRNRVFEYMVLLQQSLALHILRSSFGSFGRTCERFCWEDSDRADERGQDLEPRGRALCFQPERASTCSYCSLASAERSVPATSQ